MQLELRGNRLECLPVELGECRLLKRSGLVVEEDLFNTLPSEVKEQLWRTEKEQAWANWHVLEDSRTVLSPHPPGGLSRMRESCCRGRDGFWSAIKWLAASRTSQWSLAFTFPFQVFLLSVCETMWLSNRWGLGSSNRKRTESEGLKGWTSWSEGRPAGSSGYGSVNGPPLVCVVGQCFWGEGLKAVSRITLLGVPLSRDLSGFAYFGSCPTWTALHSRPAGQSHARTFTSR